MGNDLSYNATPHFTYYVRRHGDRHYVFHYMPRSWESFLAAYENMYEQYGFQQQQQPEPQPQTPRNNPSGYSEDIFLHLEESEKYECSICSCVLKDSRKCIKGHKFCYNCIYTWVYEYSRLGGCPLCRTRTNYDYDKDTIDFLAKKAVQCKETVDNVTCNWRGVLADFDAHQHKQYTDEENRTRLQNSADYHVLYPEAEIVAKTEPNPQQPDKLLDQRASQATLPPLQTAYQATPPKAAPPASARPRTGRLPPATNPNISANSSSSAASDATTASASTSSSEPTVLPAVNGGRNSVIASATIRNRPSYSGAATNRNAAVTSLPAVTTSATPETAAPSPAPAPPLAPVPISATPRPLTPQLPQQDQLSISDQSTGTVPPALLS